MVSNYVTTALRKFRRMPGFTLINVAGLAIGMASCLVILSYVENETSYDRFHEHAGRIFRVTRETLEGGAATREQANTPAAVGPTLQEQYAAVEAMTRFLFPYPSSVVVRYGDRCYRDRIGLTFQSVSAVEAAACPALTGFQELKGQAEAAAFFDKHIR